jgi:hypothetical protein
MFVDIYDPVQQYYFGNEEKLLLKFLLNAYRAILEIEHM